MKQYLSILVIGLALAGCRREDIRECTIEIPGLAETNRAQVTEALMKYSGVRRDATEFDFAAGRVRVVYDSMQVAQTNLRMAIEEKGLKVVFPENRTGRAGY